MMTLTKCLSKQSSALVIAGDTGTMPKVCRRIKNNFLIVLLVLILISSCKPHSEKSNDESQLKWTTLTIVSEQSTIITINNYDDTSLVKYYDGGGFFTGWHKVKVDSLKPYFTMKEKDSIFHLAKDIIQNPVKPRCGCTEFVGDLKVVVYYGVFKDPGTFQQSIEYSGVCNWDTLSNKTIQLHKILKRKIKWWSK